jgi:hypothetical protein
MILKNIGNWQQRRPAKAAPANILCPGRRGFQELFCHISGKETDTKHNY